MDYQVLLQVLDAQGYYQDVEEFLRDNPGAVKLLLGFIQKFHGFDVEGFLYGDQD
jgi:hypothetical protein